MNEKLKKALNDATGCLIQDGWPCGQCFFSISKDFNNSDWQTVLFFRGYPKKQLDNLPCDIDKSYEKIIKACKKKGN